MPGLGVHGWEGMVLQSHQALLERGSPPPCPTHLLNLDGQTLSPELVWPSWAEHLSCSVLWCLHFQREDSLLPLLQIRRLLLSAFGLQLCPP